MTFLAHFSQETHSFSHLNVEIRHNRRDPDCEFHSVRSLAASELEALHHLDDTQLRDFPVDR